LEVNPQKEAPLKKYFVPCFLVVSIFLFIQSTLLLAGEGAKEVAPLTTRELKQYMAKFGSMMSGIEILQMKEKKPDWQAIDITLNEMIQTLQEMQKADITNAYKNYTDVLASKLEELKKMSRKRNKNIYEGFDNLTNTCFNCHAAHRPGDFLIPKEKRASTSR
jgi:hypothetical protein